MGHRLDFCLFSVPLVKKPSYGFFTEGFWREGFQEPYGGGAKALRSHLSLDFAPGTGLGVRAGVLVLSDVRLRDFQLGKGGCQLLATRHPVKRGGRGTPKRVRPSLIREPQVLQNGHWSVNLDVRRGGSWLHIYPQKFLPPPC